MGFGAKKYEDYGWAAGLDHSRVYAAILRHLFAYWRGENNDPESGESHLAHAGCGIMFLLTYKINDIGRDDRHKWE